MAPLAAPTAADLFPDLKGTERVAKFDAFQKLMVDARAKSEADWRAGRVQFVREAGVKSIEGAPADITTALAGLEASMKLKGISADSDAFKALGAVRAESEKDWTPSFPLDASLPGTYGPVPYNVEAPVAFLVPKTTPIRNETPRSRSVSGGGKNEQYRRLLGITNSNTGGVPRMSIGFNSQSASTAFGPLNLKRPPKITYDMDTQVRGFMEMGLSDSVDYNLTFQSQGYFDPRTMSHTALMWAHMIGEERALLCGRGTNANAAGYAGPVVTTGLTGTPTAVAGTGPAAATYAVEVTYYTDNGETVAISCGNVTTSGGNLSVQLVPSFVPEGAFGTVLYLTNGGTTYRATSAATVAPVFGGVGAPFTVFTGTIPVADASYDPNLFDGWLTVLSDPAQAGYVKRLEAPLSTSTPTVEFQNAFAAMNAFNLADPDDVICSGAVRVELTDSVQQQGNPNSYRIEYGVGPDGIMIGKVVTAIQNATTSKVVKVDYHPYLPGGVAMIRTLALPIPDSGVNAVAELIFPQGADMSIIDWPFIQMGYDVSSYAYGGFLFRAPAWSGAILGIL